MAQINKFAAWLLEGAILVPDEVEALGDALKQYLPVSQVILLDQPFL